MPQIECYAGLLNQAFLNILNHAIDVLEESSQELKEPESIKFKPVIVISTQVVDTQRISIEITDNGMAISEISQRKFLTRFCWHNLRNQPLYRDWLSAIG